MGKTRILVLGGGIAGISAAYSLAVKSRDLEITLLEAESSLTHHTTGRSAAQLIQNYGAPANRALTRAGIEFLRNPPSELFDSPVLSPRGEMMMARSKDTAEVERLVQEAAESGIDLEHISVDAANEIFPLVRGELYESAVVEPDSADIDVAALHQGFVRGFVSRGGTLVTEQRVIAINRRPNKWLVSTAGSEFIADVLINATGAWGDQVAELAGLSPIGLRPLRRTAFMVKSKFDESPHWPLVAEIDHSWYVKPDGAQFLCSPADETLSEPCDAKPEEIDIAIAIDRINTGTKLELRSVASSWAGLRTFAPDDAIVIGPDPADESFFWCVGQGGTGIQSAPGAGRLVADLVVDHQPSDYFVDSGLVLDEVLPARFSS